MIDAPYLGKCGAGRCGSAGPSVPHRTSLLRECGCGAGAGATHARCGTGGYPEDQASPRALHPLPPHAEILSVCLISEVQTMPVQTSNEAFANQGFPPLNVVCTAPSKSKNQTYQTGALNEHG